MKKNFLYLNALHILNDGFEAGFLILLPFIAKDLHINLAQVGVLSTVEKILIMILSIPAGYLALKFGGLRTIIVALLIYSIGFMLTSFAYSFLFLLFTFIVAGIGFGLFNSIGLALAAKWSDKKTIGRQMGNYSATGDLGKVIFPAALTFLIGFIGWRSATFSFSILGIFIFLISLKIFVALKDTVRLESKQISDVPIKKFFTNKLFVLANIINVFDNIGSSSLYIYLPFLLLERGLSPFMLGLVVACFFIGNIGGKTILGWFVDIFGNIKIVVFSEILMAIIIVILANLTYIPFIVLMSLLLGVFTKGTLPVIKTMVTDSVAHHNNFQKAFGLNVFFGGAGVAISALVLGLVADRFGIISSFYVAAGFSLLTIFPVFVFSYIKRKEDEIA